LIVQPSRRHEHFRNALNWENADAITKSGTGRPRKTYLYALLNMCRLMPPQRSSGSKIEIQLTGVMRAQLEHVTGRYLTSDKPLTDDECSFVVAACCMQWCGNRTSNKSESARSTVGPAQGQGQLSSVRLPWQGTIRAPQREPRY